MMHRIIRDHLEQVLGERPPAPEHPAGQHLAECEECRQTVVGMREQAAMLRQWRAEVEPRPGFYARVLERIEAQRPISVFTLFFDSLFARRIAMASLALALLLGVYVVSSEQAGEPALVSNQISNLTDDLPDVVYNYGQPRLVTGTPDQDAVLVNLVTYREQ